MTDDFLTPETFMKEIERIVKEIDLNYLEAVTHFCSKHRLDIEDVVPMIKRSMKEKIKLTAMELGMMKKEGKLPI